jgi:hypothetical protein
MLSLPSAYQCHILSIFLRILDDQHSVICHFDICHMIFGILFLNPFFVAANDICIHFAISLSLSLSHTHTQIHMHTHTLSLSHTNAHTLSLSLSSLPSSSFATSLRAYTKNKVPRLFVKKHFVDRRLTYTRFCQREHGPII